MCATFGGYGTPNPDQIKIFGTPNPAPPPFELQKWSCLHVAKNGPEIVVPQKWGRPIWAPPPVNWAPCRLGTISSYEEKTMKQAIP